MRFLRDIMSIAIAFALVTTLIRFAIAHGPQVAAPHQAPVSEVVFPTQELPLRFSHVLHLTRTKVDCEACHVRIRLSASALDNNLPREADCAGCHEIDRKNFEKNNGAGVPPGNCVACHVGFDAERGTVQRVRLPIPNLKFSHQSHLARGANCQTCHGDYVAQRVSLATREQLPKMRTCLGCHDGREAPDECTTCHLSEAGGVVQTRFSGLGTLSPTGSLRGAAHDLKFRESHKYVAQNDQDFCASCHKKDFCSDCHNGVSKPMDFHMGDYISIHAIDARRNSPDCSSCHRIQTFCQGCHSRMGVAADNKGSEFGAAGRYHPLGWVQAGMGAGVRGPNHHSFEAQRNIKQCASCHRESFCTQCHSAQTGSLGANPHPRNWRGSRRCRALLERSRRMCLRCHVDSAPLRCQ